MEKLKKQVAEFVDLLKLKGLDGHYSIDGQIAGRIDDSLYAYLNKDSVPTEFDMYTFLDWDDKNRVSYIATFKMAYSHEHGLTVREMETRANAIDNSRMIAQYSYAVEEPKSILNRKEAMDKVRPDQKELKKKQARGIRH